MLVNGGLISEGIFLWSHPEKMCQITIFDFFDLDWKVDVTKFKIHYEITPPLSNVL